MPLTVHKQNLTLANRPLNSYDYNDWKKVTEWYLLAT